MDQGEGEVLEEEETQEFTHANVGPAAVHQQKTLQVTELGEGVVAGHDGLHPLLTADAHTNVGGWRDEKTSYQRVNRDRKESRFIHVLTFDHVDVVGSVSDRQGHSLLVLLHQTHHIGFLFGRDAAADDGFALAGHVHEVNLWTKIKNKM